MKKKYMILYFAVIFGLFADPLPIQNYATSFIIGDHVRLREKPSTKSKILYSFCSGQSVTVRSSAQSEVINGIEGKWLEVEFTNPNNLNKKFIGYVFDLYVKRPSEFKIVQNADPFFIAGCAGEACWFLLFIDDHQIYSRSSNCTDNDIYCDYRSGTICDSNDKIIAEKSTLEFCVKHKYWVRLPSATLYEHGKVRFLFRDDRISDVFILDKNNKWQDSFYNALGACQ